MDMAYFTGLFPALRDQQAGYELFYEVKSGLRRAQLKLMAQAGVTHIQPGIESLSTHVLHLMRKGVRAIQNVNLLRWAQYYDIRAEWNILWGFPGETEQDYAGQAAVIPHLRHLRPPAVAGRIWLERFSPLFTGNGTLPLGQRKPERSYRYVYPGDVDLDRAAYFFDYDTAAGLPDSAYAGVRAAAAEWSGAWQAGPLPVLTYWAAPRYVQIYDERQPGAGGTYTFEGTLADLYLACTERPVTAAAGPPGSGPAAACGRRAGGVRGVPPARPDVPRRGPRPGPGPARGQGPLSPMPHPSPGAGTPQRSASTCPAACTGSAQV